MDCTNCGAPLPPKSNICAYCETLNDVDLRAVQPRADVGPVSHRLCPRCQVNMVSIPISVGRGFHAERCEQCMGIFFDRGELESILNHAVSNVFTVDHQRMMTIVNEEGRSDTNTVSYVPCPDCGELMNRRVFGAKSGVVTDTCINHGVWLDGGELGQLLKWTKAGGQIHDAQQKQQQQHDEARKTHLRELEERIERNRGWSSHTFVGSPRAASPLGEAIVFIAKLLS